MIRTMPSQILARQLSKRYNTSIIGRQYRELAGETSIRVDLFVRSSAQGTELELKNLMYGFGDSARPNEGTLDLLETYTEEFVANLTSRALKRSQRHGSNVLQLGDVLKVLQKDEKKFLRMPYILASVKEVNPKLARINRIMEYAGDDAKKAVNFNKMQ